MGSVKGALGSLQDQMYLMSEAGVVQVRCRSEQTTSRMRKSCTEKERKKERKKELRP